jgi:GTP cyclohydrolase II
MFRVRGTDLDRSPDPRTFMSDLPASTRSYVPGALEDVDRALSELRRGWPVVLHAADGSALLVLAAEAGTDERLRALGRHAGKARGLILTGPRAQALGLPGAEGRPMRLDARALSAGTVAAYADPTAIARPVTGRQPGIAPADALEAAAVDLVKLARLLPAAVAAPAETGGADPVAWAVERGLLALAVGEVEAYRSAAARSLSKVAEARVPLMDAEDCRIVAFRPADGGLEHLAIVIGRPDAAQAVTVRLHSECFTGDLLGSLRCDCGDQLRGAIRAIADPQGDGGGGGAGVLLYLAQEGRGIGLTNKLRAYTLQDRGADTHEANLALGFDADERVYLPAAEMLRQLGIQRVRLLTNNPEKVDQLARCGIAVVDRVAHSFPSNGHNEAYLATKAEKFGHWL